jgi:hypothetical protein
MNSQSSSTQKTYVPWAFGGGDCLGGDFGGGDF